MHTATISNQGQIIIPEQVRLSLQLEVGDSVGFIMLENGMVVMRPVARKVEEVFGLLYRPEQAPLTIEEMNAAVAHAFTNQSEI